jgi:hypothetical protein
LGCGVKEKNPGTEPALRGEKLSINSLKIALLPQLETIPSKKYGMMPMAKTVTLLLS